MKLQARVFVKDGTKYFQTVATKGKEIIPFVYRGDIIFLRLINEDKGHDEMHDKVVSCLSKQQGINYKHGRWNTSGSMAAHLLEETMWNLGYVQDEQMLLEDLDIENATLLSWTQVEMMKMQNAEAELYAKEQRYLQNGKV
tara:strand:- start:889 stop:1311 length:423 start_codon:yes stop_codon:yes gene_type:complete